MIMLYYDQILIRVQITAFLTSYLLIISIPILGSGIKCSIILKYRRFTQQLV